MSDARLERFWSQARTARPTLPAEVPEAWAFGATPEHADELLGLVLDGTKTGTASALWDIEVGGEAVPEVDDLSVILDGRGRPRAVIITTAVTIVPFAEVSAEHAYAEGEGDRSLEDWRGTHERFWRRYGQSSLGFAENMPIVCERFRIMYKADELKD